MVSSQIEAEKISGSHPKTSGVTPNAACTNYPTSSESSAEIVHSSGMGGGSDASGGSNS